MCTTCAVFAAVKMFSAPIRSEHTTLVFPVPIDMDCSVHMEVAVTALRD